MNRKTALLGLLIVFATCFALRGANLWRPDRFLTGNDNIQVAEGQSWLQGKLDLPERWWDTAFYNGKIYSHFPPMFTIVSMIAHLVFGRFPHAFLIATIVVPLLVIAYRLFIQITKSWQQAATMTIALVVGTSLWPVLDQTVQTSGPWFVNQTLGTIGLLIFLFDLTGRRRMWLGAIGLSIAALSRQMTVIYFPILVWSAFCERHRQGGGYRLAAALAGLAIALGLPAALNAAKFGNPLDPGYMHIYVGRENNPRDTLAQDALTYGIFSPHYVPRNLYYANIGFWVRSDSGRLWPNPYGTGIWWTTPLLLWALVDARRWWKAAPLAPRALTRTDVRGLLLAVVAIIAVLMCYHSTGYAQSGYNRYSLDYVPVLLALMAPRCLQGARKWISAGMIAWSVYYFAWLV